MLDTVERKDDESLKITRVETKIVSCGRDRNICYTLRGHDAFLECSRKKTLID